MWGLVDHFVDEVIQLYRSRGEADRALAAVLLDEPEWEGMIEVVPFPHPCDRHWSPTGRRVRRPRCRQL